MPDATLADFTDLVGKVHLGIHPIMPQPTWGQDAAYLAFMIDGLRERIAAFEAAQGGNLGKADWNWDEELGMHIPCCTMHRSASGPPCGNGPLTGEQIAKGDCGEH